MKGPLVLLVPSRAAALELPRRLASTGQAVTGLYPMKLLELARAVAEPALLGRGLKTWDTGHDALLAARLLAEGGFPIPPELPRAPVARTLARTLSALRRAGVDPARLQSLPPATPEDGQRLHAMGRLYRGFHQAIEGRFADPATLLRAARTHLPEARWLAGAEMLIVDDLELDALQAEFLAALAAAFPVRALRHDRPAGLDDGSFAAWAREHGITETEWTATTLAPLAPPPVPAGLARLRSSLFDPPSGPSIADGSVELVTAPGEAAEVRTIVRRLIREAARGVPFEEMGVVLPQPREYAPLFTDLLERLGIPYRLHPSLPLDTGRTARSLLLLFRCRGLSRSAVMEFLTFAPVPFAELLGDGVPARPAQWDALSREAGIVSGLERWIIGLRAFAEEEREAHEDDLERRARRERRAGDADGLLRVVELLSATLDSLSGEATWGEWSDRLRVAFDQWLGGGRDRQAVGDVLADLAALGDVGARAPWGEVEDVLEARFEWERVPVDPLTTGAIHLGALDAIAGLPFRVVAIPGLVEGGYPGVLRPDPFLLDPEREEISRPTLRPPRTLPTRGQILTGGQQLSLFDTAQETLLPTTQDRLREARRLFHRAVSQATERLIVSYPRADARTGRERLPSLFFVAAAAAREGKPLSAAELDPLVGEDNLASLSVNDALDATERDRIRLREGGREAALGIAAGSVFFRQAHLASEARWSNRLTAYDGLVNPLPEGLAARLDPITDARPISASRLATFANCGFQYLLQHVLRLEPALEPEERMRLEPLERGDLFHRAAEAFLREGRERGELPVRDTPALRERLLEMGDELLRELVAGSPPRFTVLWEKERTRFHELLRRWLAREAGQAERATPAWFEVSFGAARERAPGEPHSIEPLAIDLGDGRTLRVSGKIDRIDRRPDGTLSLRDYKTGRAPRDEGGIFRGGRQLQIPFYVLAAARLFPEQPVVEAFLDYVDGGRRVAFDPELVKSEAFRALLRGLVDAIAAGVFVQEPTACNWCDYTAVCGPRPLLERKRAYKVGDKLVQAVLRLRETV